MKVKSKLSIFCNNDAQICPALSTPKHSDPHFFCFHSTNHYENPIQIKQMKREIDNMFNLLTSSFYTPGSLRPWDQRPM